MSSSENVPDQWLFQLDTCVKQSGCSGLVAISDTLVKHISCSRLVAISGTYVKK